MAEPDEAESPMKEEVARGKLEDLFLTTFRGMPTANAEGARSNREGGIEKVSMSRILKYLQIGHGVPRRSPSACSETFLLKNALGKLEALERRLREAEPWIFLLQISRSAPTANADGLGPDPKARRDASKNNKYV